MSSKEQLGNTLKDAFRAAVVAEAAVRQRLSDAIRDAYREPARAETKIAEARWSEGAEQTIKMLETDPSRFGLARGSMLSRDGWTLGAPERAAIAGEALALLPKLARELGGAEDRVRAARDAYVQHCRGMGQEPDIESPPHWTDDPRSVGAARVPGEIAERYAANLAEDRLDWLQEPSHRDEREQIKDDRPSWREEQLGRPVCDDRERER